MPSVRPVEVDDGSAVVEFVLVAVLVLVPFAYAVLAIAAVERAAFAVTAATREAGRAFVTAPTGAAGRDLATGVAELALTDHGVAPTDPLDVRCETDPCLAPGARVTVRMTVRVPIPLVPHLRGRAPAVIPVRARHVVVVDELRERRP